MTLSKSFAAGAGAVRRVIVVTYGDIRVGLVYTCHTIGLDLVFRPYVHLVMTKGLAAASYIDRYMGHSPLAMFHLTRCQGKQVRFWYKETATGLLCNAPLSALDFISLIVKHIPPKGMQLIRHAGLYTRNTKAKWAEKVSSALDAIRCQFPLFELNHFTRSSDPLTWRQRFQTSFGRDPLPCLNCQTIMELVEIWEPEHRYDWMKRWREIHRNRKMAAQTLARFLAACPYITNRLLSASYE